MKVLQESMGDRDERVKNEFLVNITKRMGKDALIYIPGSVMPALVSLIGLTIFTRVFSADEYGYYALVLATINILVIIFGSWLQHAILRYRATYIENSQTHEFNKSLFITLLLITLLIIIGFAAFFIFRNSINDVYIKYLAPAVCLLLVDIWFNNVSYILIADTKSKSYSVMVAAHTSLSLIISILWVFIIRKDIVGLIWGLFLSKAILLIPLLLIVRNPRTEIAAETKEVYIVAFIKEMARYGIPMIGWLLGTYILNISDRYFLQFLRGSSEVGIYSSNYSIVMGVSAILTTPLFLSGYSHIMKTAAESSDKGILEELIEMFSRYYLIVSIPIFAFIALFSKEIANLFLGQEFREGFIIIPIILLGYFAWNYAMFGHKGLELFERTRTMLVFVMICAIINIALNTLLVPPFGYLGAAIATLLSLIVYPILVFMGTRNILRWRIPWRSLRRIITATLITMLVMIPFKFIAVHFAATASFISAGVIGIIIYLFVLYKSGEFMQYEIDFAKAIRKKGEEGKR